jgi:putative ABC transport system permease protein
LQTLGFSGLRVFAIVMMETLLVSFAGGVVGVGLALAVLAWTGLAVGTEGVTIAFEPSPRLGVIGLLVAVAVGALAGLAPAWRAARADIVASLRAV